VTQSLCGIIELFIVFDHIEFSCLLTRKQAEKFRELEILCEDPRISKDVERTPSGGEGG
jgi:hypothetical protein